MSSTRADRRNMCPKSGTARARRTSHF